MQKHPYIAGPDGHFYDLSAGKAHPIAYFEETDFDVDASDVGIVDSESSSPSFRLDKIVDSESSSPSFRLDKIVDSESSSPSFRLDKIVDSESSSPSFRLDKIVDSESSSPSFRLENQDH